MKKRVIRRGDIKNINLMNLNSKLIVSMFLVFILINGLIPTVIAPSHPVSNLEDEGETQLEEQIKETEAEEVNVEVSEVFDAGLTADSPLYFIDTVIDDVRLGLSSEEKKSEVAAEIYAERAAEIGELAVGGDVDAIIETAAEAEEKIGVVQEEIAPETSKYVGNIARTSTGVLAEVKEKVPEEAKDAIENAINRQIVQSKKTEIVAEITTKIDELCTELIELIGLEATIEQEPRCDPDFENSPRWLKRKATTDYKDFDDAAKEKFIDEMSICFNDPRACRCNEIPIKSFSNTCHQIIPSVIKCQFEQDVNACQRVEEISSNSEAMFEGLPDDVRVELEAFFREKESEAFEKNAPRECVSAGATTVKECEKIMFGKFAPKECVEAGATTRQECESIMTEKYGGSFGGAPSECIRDGKFIGADECQGIMIDKFLPAECREANAKTPQACQEIMTKKYSAQIPSGAAGASGAGGFNIESAIAACQQQGLPREQCESVIRSQTPSFPQSGFAPGAASQIPNVQQNFDRAQQRANIIPSECEGLTLQECSAQTGQEIPTSEIPAGIIFQDGEAIPVTESDVQSALANVGVEHEINVNDVISETSGSLAALESGAAILEQTPATETAPAISESASAPAESSGGGESAPATGAAILDFVNRI